MKKCLYIGIYFLFTGLCFGQIIPVDSLYLGQTPPGDSAIVFAPGIISLESRFEQSIAFSPDSSEIVFGISNSNWDYFSIFMMKYNGSAWSEPVRAPFLGETGDGLTPIYSYDNSKVFFTSSRPQYPPVNIWMSERTDTGWMSPVKMEPPINTSSVEFEVSISANNTLYFSSTRSGGIGDIDNYSSKLEDGEYKNVINLGRPLNTNKGDDSPFIAQDESYLIFASDRVGSYEPNKRDLYISYKKTDNTWTNPKNMGPKINTTGYDLYPYVSPDNKYLFFTRRESWLNSAPSDIYWISVSIIESLKHTNFIPYVKLTIPNQTDTLGRFFSFTFSDSTFIDDDGNNTLTYSATLSNGNPLPAWLLFNPTTRTFSGTPTATGTFIVKVTATDTANASASTTFNFVVITPVSVDEEKNQHPEDFGLQQNFPNPFNPSTSISFSLPSKSFVSLKVFDLMGRDVSTIVFEELSAGTYTRQWNAAEIPSGIYFYRLQSVNNVETKKLVLLK